MHTLLPALWLTKAIGRNNSISAESLFASAPDGGTTAVVAWFVVAVLLGLVFRRFLWDVGESLVGLVAALLAPLPTLGRIFVGGLLAGLTVGAVLVGLDFVDPDPSALGAGPPAGEVADQAMQVARDAHPTSVGLPVAVQLLVLGFVFVLGFAVGGAVEQRTLNAQWRRLAYRRRVHNESVRRRRPDPGVDGSGVAPARPPSRQPAEMEARRE